MKRVAILMTVFVCDLFRSRAGIVPVSAGLAFSLIAFEYGMDQAQFITVAGVGNAVICWLTAILLTGRANRASSHLLLVRLHRRSELLLALVVGSLVIMAILSVLVATGNLLTGRLTLNFPSVAWVLPTWLALWLLAATLALTLSNLVARGGSNLLGYAFLVLMLVVNDRRTLVEAHGMAPLAQATGAVLWPITTLLSRASEGRLDSTYFVALVTTLGSAFLLYGLAAGLFARKDLLWTE